MAIKESSDSSFRSVYRTWRRHGFKQVIESYIIQRPNILVNSVFSTWQSYIIKEITYYKLQK